MNSYEIRLKLLDVSDLLRDAEQIIRHLDYDNRQKDNQIENLQKQVAIFEKALMQSRIAKSLAIADRNRLVKDE